MAIDTGIYGLAGRGVRSVDDYNRAAEELMGMQQQRQQAAQMGALNMMLGQQKADEYTRGIQRAGELRALGGAWGAQTTDEQRIADMRNKGFHAEADALEKTVLERGKTKAAIAKDAAATASTALADRIKAHEFHIQKLGAVADPQSASAWLADSVKGGLMSMQEAQQGMQALQQMGPQGFNDWKTRTMQGGMSVVEQMKAAREGAAAADTRANNILVPGAGGAYVPNQPLIDAKALIARSGASNISMGLGSPVAVTGPNGQPMLVQPPNKAGGKAQVVTIDGMPVTPVSSDKMTEDQSKAAGWLVQATNAFGNMQSALSSSPDAARPGVADAVASFPGLGGVGNAFRTADRQKFVQGASSLSEALLRAATGAGVNKDEAQQKVQELTPVWGEKPETTRQKMAAIPLYIESLKVRAGQAGARQASTVIQQTAPAVPAASGGFRYLGKE